MILVTGGTGFVGSYLLFDLIKSGEKVRALKRKNSSTYNIYKIFSFYSSNPDELFSQIEWVEGDVLDLDSLLSAMEGVTEVYHCAGIVSFLPLEKEKMMKVNIEGTENIVTASLEKKINKLCYISSASTLETNLISNYSISKQKGEEKIRNGIKKGLKAIIINPTIILGAGGWENNDGNLFVAIWKGFKYYSDGVAGFVDIKDVSSVMIKLMKSNIVNDGFIISSEDYSYKQLIDKIAKNLNVKKPYIYLSPFFSKIAWKVENIKNILFEKKPILTKEMIVLVNEKTYHSNQKIKDAININFIPVEDSIKQICEFFLKDYTV
ncbi:MAG: NAD-dependent epimerase/dehydratase family protein [Bacteroidales bacterium]|nr:NAD-dependent epimerase/dehydratase family protein [Bacteroidales bacterium]